jgi:hypothetical protein
MDGTQSLIITNLTPPRVANGLGLTTTLIHEVGHHLGLSHPHDGYDPEDRRSIRAEGEYFFAGVGDEVNSVMSYIDLNWDFSVFDRDHMDRYQAAAYLRSTNAIAADVLESPKAAAGIAELTHADRDAGATQARLAAHDYPAAFARARSAYLHARRAADQAAVEVPADDRTPWILRPAGAGGPDLTGDRSPAVDPVGPGTLRGAP